MGERPAPLTDDRNAMRPKDDLGLVLVVAPALCRLPDYADSGHAAPVNDGGGHF
jgi:hypothetical protein